MKSAFVVATMDRPRDLRRLLESLEAQTRLPDEVVIVDGGEDSVGTICRSVRAFPVRYLQSLPPSAARQRNIGITAAASDADLVGFLDDDVVLEASSLETMLRFWEEADEHVGGASFNLLNHPPVAWPALKLTALTESVGLYSRRRGTVTPAGFQTMIGSLNSLEFTDWLPSTASVWRADILRSFRFDEWFEGYSYLEDLDFSYRVGKRYRLAVVAGAGYYHFPAASGRGNGCQFGTREVLNRIYFVRKNSELSLGRCYLALAVRLLMSVALAAEGKNLYSLHRAYGNLIGLARSFETGLRVSGMPERRNRR